jgi:fucose permease
VPSAGLVFATLTVLGALDGLTDVAMNSQAVELQRRVGTSVITRFHALWSAGAVAGGIAASRAAAADISMRTQLLVTAVVLVAATLTAAMWLLPDRRRRHVPAPAAATDSITRRSMLVRLFLVGTAIALAELPPNEWAALMLQDRFDITAGQAGLGFVATATGMLVGRLVGDHATDRFGLERTRRGGAALAAAGVAMATFLPDPLAAGFGLFVCGLGLSSLFPLLFRAASDLTHGSHSGMAAFSSGARLGFLVASPLMGLIAETASVAVAMVAIAGTAAVAVTVVRLPAATATELAVTPTL